MTIPLSDNGLLLASTILSIGSLLFDILLLVAYLSKEKLNNVEFKLVRPAIKSQAFEART